MGAVVVLGEQGRVSGFALAGARVVVAEDADGVRAAWTSLGPDVSVVVLTPGAAAALGPLADGSPAPGKPLCVVMPVAAGREPT